jgi:hypothetical protein
VIASTGQVASQVLQRMQISGSIRCCLMTRCQRCPWPPSAAEGRGWPRLSTPCAAQLKRTYSKSTGWRLMPIDRRRDPVGELARLDHAAHQARPRRRGRWRWAATRSTCAFHSASLTTRPSGDTFTPASAPMLRWKALCGACQAERDAGLLDHLVPALDAADASP